jgi:hypothetical protein
MSKHMFTMCTSNFTTGLKYTADTATSFIYAATTHNTTVTEIHKTYVARNNKWSYNSNSILSEAEECNKSDDNDDRLSWQKVRGRTSPKTTRASTMKKINK